MKTMNKEEMLRIAMEQTAIDLNCDVGDFLSGRNRVVLSRANEKASRYLTLPQVCSIASYGGCAVASVKDAEYMGEVQNYLDSHDTGHLLETPAVYELNHIFEPCRARVTFMAMRFLPSGISEEPPVAYPLRWLHAGDFDKLYLPEWSNALCAERRELDVLGIGAYDEDKLIAFAACSADCEKMWQIGIDVLPEYRGQHLSTALTVRLKNEILRQDKVPFYSAAWCNIRSVRNALASGFIPAWADISVQKYT